jgi:hypothetical protein
VRTWAPRGQTPVLQYHFNWKTLSAAAGITWWNFYFRLYSGTIRTTEVMDFLGHLLRHSFLCNYIMQFSIGVHAL